jgi:hypothetical protein
MAPVFRIVPANTPVIEAARLAADSQLHLITNGRRTLLAPYVPRGWTRLAVHVKKETTSCAVNAKPGRTTILDFRAGSERK